MNKLREATYAIETINDCREAVRETQRSLESLVKIFNNIALGDVLTVVDKLKTLPEDLEKIHNQVSDVKWDLTDGSLPDICRCEVCEKVIIRSLDEVKDCCGSSLCVHCYDEFSRQAEEGIEAEDSEEEIETEERESLVDLARRVTKEGYNDEVREERLEGVGGLVSMLAKAHHKWTSSDGEDMEAYGAMWKAIDDIAEYAI